MSRAARYYVKQSGGLSRNPRPRYAQFRPRISQGLWRQLSDHETLEEALPLARLARQRGGLRRTAIFFKFASVSPFFARFA